MPLDRERMLAALPRRQAVFASIGAASTQLAEAHELRLDDRHTLVQTTWTIRLEPEGRRANDLMLRSTFLLRRDDGDWKIIVYLNHEDVKALLTERTLTTCGD